MADLEKTIQVIFKGSDEIAGVIGKVGSGIDSFAGKVESTTQPIADFTQNLLGVEAALAALAAGGLALVVLKAGEFQDSFNEITTLIDATGSSVDQFKQDIINYARDSTQSFDTINKAIYDAISSGEDYDRVLGTLEQAEKLGIATKAELGTAVNLLLPTLNAFGASTDQAGDYADILFTAVKNGKTTLDEIAGPMSQITGLGSSAGLSFDQLAAALAATTAMGMPTSQAVTGIKAAISNILKPSEQAKELAGELGIKFDAQALAADGLAGFLDKVYTATGGNVTSMGQLFGSVEGLNTVLALGADPSGKYAESLEAMANRAGAVETAYGKMAENFGLINQKLVNNINATLIEIGTPLLDDWSGLANSIGEIFKGVSISFNDGAFDPLFDKIQQLGGELTEWLKGVAEALPDALALIDWGDFTKSIDNIIDEVGDLFKAFFGDLDLTESEDLAKAIQKIVDGFTALNNVVAGVLDAFEPFIEQVSDYIDKILDSDEETQKLAGNFLGFGTAINEIAGVVGGFGGALDLVSGALVTLASTSTINTIVSLFGKFGTSLTPVLTQLGAFAGYAAAFGVGWVIGDWLRDNVPLVKEFGDSLANAVLALQGLDEKSIDAIESSANETYEMGQMAVAAVNLKEKLGELPSQQTTDVKLEGTEESGKTLDDFLQLVKSAPTQTVTEIKAEASTTQVQQEFNKIYAVADEEGKPIEIAALAVADQNSFATVKKEIDEVPKTVEMQLKFEKLAVEKEIAELKIQGEVLQTAFEWQAKVDIAEVEAVFEAMEVTAKTISDTFESSGDVILGLASLLGDVDSSKYLDLMALIREENARRNEMLLLEKELTEAQVRFLDAKTESLNRGEGLIKIQADGVYPELELVLFKIIELAQIRATEEDLNLLLGI